MSVIVFDMDGCLANIEHRLHYVRTKPKNWPAFAKGIVNDKLNIPVAMAFNAFAQNPNNTMLICSGRNEHSRNDTVKWLQKHDLYDKISKLYMRADGDYRDDGIVKSEMLDILTEEYGFPDLWIDDRPRVVKTLRDRGVFVFDVYQGTEDF